MSCDPKTYNNITPDIYNCLNGKLQAVGYALQGNSGRIQGPMGIVIDYDWNESAGTLFVQVVEKNFFIPCSRVYAELEKAIQSCR